MAMNVTLYHNPRCSKSRQTLALLEAHGGDFETVEYLKTPLDAQALKAIVAKLGDHASIADVVRTGEQGFKDRGLSLDEPEAVFAAIAEEPILMQRPIVVAGDKARVGRPPESVLEIL